MNTIFKIVLSFAAISPSLQSSAITRNKMRARCNEDLLSTKEKAEQRIRWFARCFVDDIREESWGNSDGEIRENWINQQLYKGSNPSLGYLPKVYFPVFVTTDGNKTWNAPIDKNASCDVPGGYAALIACEDGCYTGGMRVLFQDGYIPIAEAKYENLDRIVTLSKYSNLDNIDYTTTEVESYLFDLEKKEQTIIILKMSSGGYLEITPNHPVLTSDGIMREVADLTTNNSLIREDGSFDKIISISKKKIFDKVYNVYPKTKEKLENIVVAEGYLNGSAWYQNEAKRLLNRKMLRSNMPIEEIM